MKLVKFCMIVSLFLVGSLVAQPARRNVNGHGHRGKGDGTRMAQELGLSKEQQAQLKELRQKHKTERPNTREEVKALRRQIAEELKKNSPSKSKIKTLADRIGEIHAANAVRMADHMLEIKKILTPEQFSKMLDMKEQKGQRKQQMGKGRGPGGKKHHGHGKGKACCPN